MKKLIIATLLIGMMGGCTEPTVKKQTTQIITGQCRSRFNIVIIEGCEYLEYEYGSAYSLCHKGNCSNPIHKEVTNE
jgi:hypothetical protein